MLAETDGVDDGDGALLELSAAEPLVVGLVLAESVDAVERVGAGVEDAEPVLRADGVGWPVADVVEVAIGVDVAVADAQPEREASAVAVEEGVTVVDVVGEREPRADAVGGAEGEDEREPAAVAETAEVAEVEADGVTVGDPTGDADMAGDPDDDAHRDIVAVTGGVRVPTGEPVPVTVVRGEAELVALTVALATPVDEKIALELGTAVVDVVDDAEAVPGPRDGEADGDREVVGDMLGETEMLPVLLGLRVMRAESVIVAESVGKLNFGDGDGDGVSVRQALEERWLLSEGREENVGDTEVEGIDVAVPLRGEADADGLDDVEPEESVLTLPTAEAEPGDTLPVKSAVGDCEDDVDTLADVVRERADDTEARGETESVTEFESGGDAVGVALTVAAATDPDALALGVVESEAVGVGVCAVERDTLGLPETAIVPDTLGDGESVLLPEPLRLGVIVMVAAAGVGVCRAEAVTDSVLGGDTLEELDIVADADGDGVPDVDGIDTEACAVGETVASTVGRAVGVTSAFDGEIAAVRLSERAADEDVLGVASVDVVGHAGAVVDALRGAVGADDTLALRDTLGDRVIALLTLELTDGSADREPVAERAGEREKDGLRVTLADAERLADAEDERTDVRVVESDSRGDGESVRLTDTLGDDERVGDTLRDADALPGALRETDEERETDVVAVMVGEETREAVGDGVVDALRLDDTDELEERAADALGIEGDGSEDDVPLTTVADGSGVAVVLAVCAATVGVRGPVHVELRVPTDVADGDAVEEEVGALDAVMGDALADELGEMLGDGVSDRLGLAETEAEPVAFAVRVPPRTENVGHMDADASAETEGEPVVVFDAAALREPDGDVLGLIEVDADHVQRAVTEGETVTRATVAVTETERAGERDAEGDAVSTADAEKDTEVVATRLLLAESVPLNEADCSVEPVAVKDGETLGELLSLDSRDALTLALGECDAGALRVADGLGDMLPDTVPVREESCVRVGVAAVVEETESRGDGVRVETSEYDG